MSRSHKIHVINVLTMTLVQEISTEFSEVKSIEMRSQPEFVDLTLVESSGNIFRLENKLHDHSDI